MGFRIHLSLAVIYSDWLSEKPKHLWHTRGLKNQIFQGNDNPEKMSEGDLLYAGARRRKFISQNSGGGNSWGYGDSRGGYGDAGLQAGPGRHCGDPAQVMRERVDTHLIRPQLDFYLFFQKNWEI